MKTSALIISLVICCNCTQAQATVSNSVNKSDTIVHKRTIPVTANNSYFIQTIKEIEYFVSVDNQHSNLKYNFSERNDGKAVIRMLYDFPNLPAKESIFEFDELKYVLEEAQEDFKIDSLIYLVYGTLDTSKNISAVKEITRKYIEFKNNKSSISTSDYGIISNLILQSEIVNKINQSLAKFSKSVKKVTIEKAHFYKSDRDSSEILNCSVVMSIE